MKIEVGKAYKMRCGGSVRINKKNISYFFSDNLFWHKDGNYLNNKLNCPFDLIEEVPFAYGEKVKVWYHDKEDFKIGTLSYYNEHNPYPFYIKSNDNKHYCYRNCELYTEQEEDEAQELIKRLNELGYSAQITKR